MHSRQNLSFHPRSLPGSLPIEEELFHSPGNRARAMHSRQSSPSILAPCQECIAPTIQAKSSIPSSPLARNASPQRPEQPRPSIPDPLPESLSPSKKSFFISPGESGTGDAFLAKSFLLSSPPARNASPQRSRQNLSFYLRPLPGMHRPTPTPGEISSSYPPPSRKSSASIKITAGYH